MSLPMLPDIDDRRTCSQCMQLQRIGTCQAARSGVITASRNYQPNRNLLRRCEAYQPDKSDPDQRVGWKRWPNLNAPQTPREKTRK